jgi:predicted ATPase
LDEPENSLSAEFQIELKAFLEASVRAYNCQFVISTHSPFLLSMQGATIYDLDVTPPQIRPWTEIKNVRIYHDFFMEHDEEFS